MASIHRRTLIGLLLTLALLVLLTHLLVDRLSRELPNYNEIEPGFYLGGFVSEPPSGVVAVLNLCETEDNYRVAFHRWEPICDCVPAPTLDWLREQVQFIDDQRREARTI